jgi:hypothetical protein
MERRRWISNDITKSAKNLTLPALLISLAMVGVINLNQGPMLLYKRRTSAISSQ